MAARRAEEIGLAFGEARQRPGGTRGVGHRRAAGEVVARQTLGEIGQQRAFARLALAEEMGAAGDVEQQAGIAAEAAGAAGFDAFLGDGAAQRIDRHPGRVAVAPVGEGLDQAMVGLRLARCRDQVGHQRARIGEPHVRTEAGGAGMRVDRDQARTALEPDDGRSSPSRPVVRVALASRSVESLGNHRETMRFIVPLQEPGWCFGDRGDAETVSSELDAPARGADVVEAGRRMRGRRGDAPARRAHALRWRGLAAQQQRGHAALLGGERQAAAGGEIGRARLAQHGGHAGAAQAFFHGPEQILVAPHRDHQQARRIEPGGEGGCIRRRIGRAEGTAAPQQRAVGPERAEAAQQMGGETRGRAIVRGDTAGRRADPPRSRAGRRSAGRWAAGRRWPARRAARPAGRPAGRCGRAPGGAPFRAEPPRPGPPRRWRPEAGGAKAFGEMTGIAPSKGRVKRGGD